MFLNKKNQKGFTLTELIVVIVIIAILAGVMLPTLTSYITRANKSADEQKVAGINTLLTEAQITEKVFEDALELKDYLENDMDYDGDYSLKLKGSYMWYDLKEGKVVIITEDDEELEVAKLAATDKAEFVTVGNLRSPEGLMQYSDETEVWLIGGNGYLVELVEEIRNIGDNGAGNLEEFNSLKNETVKKVFEEFFEKFAFSGEEGIFEVVDGVATKVQTTDKTTVKTNNKLSLAELFHKEVILANWNDIEDKLEENKNVSLTLVDNGNDVEIIINETEGLGEAAVTVVEIINLLINNDCKSGYIFNKLFNSIDEYENHLGKIVACYNEDVKDGEYNGVSVEGYTITKDFYDTLYKIDGGQRGITVEDLAVFYKVDLEELVGQNLDVQAIKTKLDIALNLNLVNKEYQYTQSQSTETMFKGEQSIVLIGQVTGDKPFNVQYNFIFKDQSK